MLRNKIIPFLFLLLAAGNRAVSQSFSVGGIYYYELLVFLAVAVKPKRIMRELKANLAVVVLVVYAITILVVEIALYGVDVLAFRRAALGVYAITPVIVFAYHDEIKNWIAKNYNTFIAMILLFSIIQVGGFQSTMAAQLVGALAFFEMVSRGVRWRTILLCAIYLLLVSGVLAGQSVYRTPLLTILVAAPLALWLGRGSAKIKKKNMVYIVFAIFFMVALSISGALSKPLGSILLGISGALDSPLLMDAGISLGAEVSSTRGDASGTAKTRIIFWDSIIEYQLANLNSFVFGYGLQNGFMEVTLPDMPFIDRHLVEPHNSFLNLFFRFGIVGLALYAVAIFLAYRSISRVCNNALPYLVISLLFASAEVALENPHGNVVFWFILFIPALLPCSVTERSDLSYGKTKLESNRRS